MKVALYAVRCLATGEVKIGKTSNPKKRLSDLARYNRSGMETIRIDDDAGEVEKPLHWLLSDRRINGEWFKLHPQECANIFDAIKRRKFIRLLRYVARLPENEKRPFCQLAEARRLMDLIMLGRFRAIEDEHLHEHEDECIEFEWVMGIPEDVPTIEPIEKEIDAPPIEITAADLFPGHIGSLTPSMLAKVRWSNTSEAERKAYGKKMNKRRNRFMSAKKRREYARIAGIARGRQKTQERLSRIAREAEAEKANKP